MIDFRRRAEVEIKQMLDEIVAWTAPARERLGVEVALPEANGAQRARRALADGQSIEQIYRESVVDTKRTYGVEELVK